MYLMDNASVCSDDTDVLINASSCHFGDIRTNNAVNLANKTDKYLLTERYVNENSSPPGPFGARPSSLQLGRKQEYTRHADVAKPQPTSYNTHATSEPNFTHVTNAYKIPHHDTGVDSKYGIELRISPPSRRDDPSQYTTDASESHLPLSPYTPTSIMKMSHLPSPPKSVVFSSSISPKSVKFEAAVSDRCSASDAVSRLSLGDLESLDNDSQHSRGFEVVDEKVKEGKEILARLLNSTDSKNHYKPRTSDELKCNVDDAKAVFSFDIPSNEQGVNKTREEVDDGTFTLSQTGSLLQSRDLRDPIFTSTRTTDSSDEKPAFQLKEMTPHDTQVTI